MRLTATAQVFVIALGVCAAALAQPADALDRATAEANHVRALVEAGVMPRASLEQVEQDLADAQDQRILERTLYGNAGVEDLTERQAEDMLAAATRRFDRRKAKVEHAKKLVEEGALPRLALTPYLEELDRSRRTVDLARSRADLLRELAAMARAEQQLLARVNEPHDMPDLTPLAERFLGAGAFRMSDLKEISAAFEKQFARPLPVSARGETALHRALGFDHRGRVDVALDPDQAEGQWLRDLLHSLGIPFYAFRSSAPGKSTGPHIHIGPPSELLHRGG